MPPTPVPVGEVRLTTPPLVAISERCRCGASLTVEGVDLIECNQQFEQWRTRHSTCGTTRSSPNQTYPHVSPWVEPPWYPPYRFTA